MPYIVGSRLETVGAPDSNTNGGVISGESRFSRFISETVVAINTHPGRSLFGLTVLYFGITVALALIKLLWLDEFITFYISKLGGLRPIWNALAHGADPNPPLNYLLVLGSSKLFGQNALALRLPALLLSWAGLLALYAFMKRRV